MNKHPRLGFWWPLVFGTAIGVETMLSALVLFGPAPVQPEIAEQLTKSGLKWFQPEHDVGIYAAGCMLVAMLVGGFSWFWNRWLARVSDMARSEFIRQGCTQLFITAAIFLLHFGLLLAMQRWWAFKTGTLPSFPIFVLGAPVIVLFMVATARFSWNLGIAPRRFVHFLDQPPPPPHDFPKPSFHSGFDVLVPLLLCAVIYVPAWRDLAGRVYASDEFHHWDYYAMGPALAFHHGKALGTEAYTQYGVVWPVLVNALSGLIPISYGKLIQAAVLYGCLYFIGIYTFLRLVLGRPVWAAAGVIFALSLQTFHGLDATDVLWQWPSSTVLRSAMDVWFFIALVFHLRSRRVVWAGVAGGFVGLAILFETDTGCYLAIIFAAYWVFATGTKREARPLILRPLRQAVIAFVVATLILLAGLAIASRGTLLHKAFWIGWLEPLLYRVGAVGMMPIATASAGTMLLFTIMVIVYLGTVGLTVIKLLRLEVMHWDVLLGCLASYGLLVLILFVGRSHPANLFHPSVPFSLLVVIMAARGYQRLLALSKARCNDGGRNSWNSLASLFPWFALGSVGIWLVATPAFRNYPGALQRFFSNSSSSVGLCLFHEPQDVCGLPVEAQNYLRHFDTAVSSLRACVAAGQTVAILDDADTSFYLALGAPPWGRYSPCFPAIMRRSELAALQQAIVTRGAQCVMIRANGAHAQAGLYNEEDVWHAVHQTVESCYRLESTTGIFEIWRRNEK